MVSHEGTPQLSLERPAPGQRLRRRIFVSSSNIDLFAHRAAVSQVLQTMDQQVIGMEHFGAQDGDAPFCKYPLAQRLTCCAVPPTR
jgi:hypothetical protein